MLKTMGVSVLIGASLGKSYFGALDTASAQAKKLGAAWTETDKKLKAAQAVVKYRQQLQELRDKQAVLGTSSTQLAAGIAKTEQLYRKAKSEAKSYGIAVLDAANQQKKLGAELAKIEKLQGRVAAKEQAGAKLMALRGKFLGASAATYGIGRMIGSAMNVEKQGIYLRSVINAPDKDKALGDSMKHAREYARKSLASESEILGIEYQLNSAGLAADIARAGTEAVHKVATVTRGDADQVAEIIGVTFNNLGKGLTGSAVDKFNQIGSILTKVQLKYQIRDFGQLGESMKYGAAAAASFNVPLDQTATIIGQLNSAGLQGSMGGTAFKSMLGQMGKAAEELNFDIVRGNDGAMDLIATLENLNEQLADMDTDERANKLYDLFGERGVAGVVALLDKLPDLKAGLKEVSDAGKSGLVNEEYARFLNSASGQFTLLKQNLVQIGAVLGGTVLPALNVVLKPISAFMGAVAWGIEKFPPLGWILGGIAAGFIAVGAAQAIWTAAVWAFNAAWLANPITWVIGGVIALILAVSALWKNWDRIWGWMKKSAIAVGKVLKEIFDRTPIGMLIKGIGWVGDKLAGMNARHAVAGAAAAATVAATPLPASAMPQMAQAASVQSTTTVTAPITINAAPGQSEEDIGKAVADHLDRSQRDAEAQKRARLYE